MSTPTTRIRDEKDRPRDFKDSHDKSRKLLAIRYITKDILNGLGYSEIHYKMQNDEYGIGHKYSDTRINILIGEARKYIKEETKEMIPLLREDMIARFNDVYKECREQGDRANAIKAMTECGKILGLYENKVEVKGNLKQEIEINFGFNDDEN